MTGKIFLDENINLTDFDQIGLGNRRLFYDPRFIQQTVAKNEDLLRSIKSRLGKKLMLRSRFRPIYSEQILLRRMQNSEWYILLNCKYVKPFCSHTL